MRPRRNSGRKRFIMLKADKFVVKSDALKVETGFCMMDYVRSLVRNTELTKAMDKKSFKDGKKAIESAHAEIDPMTCNETVIYEVLKTDGGQFIKDRNEVLALRSEVADCIPLDKVTSLCPNDRVHVTLMAHEIYKTVQLDPDIFNSEKGGIDISKCIKMYYSKGSLKDLKNNLTAVFNKLLGSEGDYFHGIKIRKSSFEDIDLRNFLANFGGMAKKSETKGKDKAGQDVKIYGDFNYIDKSENRKVQIAAFTTLCAVILDNASKHEVIKPTKVVEENTDNSDNK